MRHRKLSAWTIVAIGLVVGSVVAGPPRERSAAPPVPPDAARLIAGQAESIRDGIDSGALATGSGPRVRIQPVQVLPASQGTVAGDTITLKGGHAIVKFEILFGGWGSTGQGLTTFQVTTQGTCVGGVNAGVACPPADCVVGGGCCGNTTGSGSPLHCPNDACASHADCSALYAPVGAPGPRCYGECFNYWQENGTHPDWPGFGTASVLNIPGCGGSGTSCGSATSNAPLPDDGTEKYALTFVLAADADARGTYTLTVDPLNVGGNFMQVTNGTVLPYGKVIPAKVTIPTGSCCFNLGPNTQCQDNVTQNECVTGHVGQTFFRAGTPCPPVGPGCAPDCPLNPQICNDADLCTLDICDPVFDCRHELIPAFNDPANQCCDPATGIVVSRDDGNECTDDRCSRGGDRGVAEHLPVPYGSPCDDGNPATVNDRCLGGICINPPPLPGPPYFRLVPVPPQGSAAPPYPPGTVLDPAHGTAIFPSRPQRIWLEIRLGGWGGQLPYGELAALRVWQAGIENIGPNEYPGGLLRPFIPCVEGVDDAYCQSLIGVGGDSRCGAGPGFTNRCRTHFVESSRDDVVGPDYGFCVEVINACGGAALAQNYGLPDGGVEYYGGTVVIDAPADIAGTVAVGFAPQDPGNNFMELQGPPTNPNYQVTIVPTLIPATLTFPVGRCCSVPTGTPVECWDSVTPAECEALGAGTTFQADATCQGDANGDGIDDACFAIIPAASEWGLLVLTLSLLALTKACFGFKRTDRGDAMTRA